MTLYDATHARNHAVDLVKTALGSGAIKLSGPLSGASHTQAGKKDAEYLATLITTLTKELSE